MPLRSASQTQLSYAPDESAAGNAGDKPSEAETPGSGTSIALGTALDAAPEALVLGVALQAGGPDLALVVALALANVPEALSGTAEWPRVPLIDLRAEPWSDTTFGTAIRTALAFYLSSDLGPHATAILKAYGAGALIAMTAER